MSKSELDTFINKLIDNQVNLVKKLTRAITEPASAESDKYHQDWYSEVAPELINNYNSSNKPTFSKRNKVTQKSSTTYDDFIINKLEESVATCPINDTFTYFEEVAGMSIDPDDDKPRPVPPEGVDISAVGGFMNDLNCPTKEAERYYHLKSTVDSYTNRIALAAKHKEFTILRSELESLQLSFPTQQEVQVQATPPSPTFGELIVEYLEYYKAEVSSPSTYNTVKRGLEVFDIELSNVPISEIKLPYLLLMWKTVLTYPLGNNKKGIDNPYAGMSPEERWDEAKDFPENMDESYLTAGSTIKKYKTALIGLFSWATSIKEVLIKNPIPTDTIILKKFNIPTNRCTKRTGFNDKQALSIINYCKTEINARYHWAILLMSRHGMRNSEVVNLRKEDILTIDSIGMPYLFIRNGKTTNARRKVPIHQDLLDLGFLEFVESLPTGRLFKYQADKLSVYYFNVLRPKLSIPETTEDGSTLSLYSFRHATVAKLGFSGVEKMLLQYLVGHKQGTTDGYFNPVNDEDYLQCQTAINTVSY